MINWTHLSGFLSRGKRRGPQATYDLANSYRRLFTGDGTKADAQTVLADLANYSKFYQVVGPDELAGETLAHANGMRTTFSRVFRFLKLSDEELDALMQASRQETITDTQEGII